MHDIVSIQSIRLDSATKDIVVEAILENMGRELPGNPLIDPPEYAPCLCKTTIWNECIPAWVQLQDSDEELEEIINRYGLLDDQLWEPIIEDNSDAYYEYDD